MKVLVTGSRGMLGTDLMAALRKAGHHTDGVDLPELDVTVESALNDYVRKTRPDAVINCAAYTDVDGCESNEALAMKVNGEAAGKLAAAAAFVNARILHIGTDFVFDGKANRPYREDDEVAPLSAYGRTKLEGDRRVAEANPDHLIVRTSWLFGAAGKNFVKAILRFAREKGELRVVGDQTGAPTYTRDLADALVRLLEVPHRGIAQFRNTGSCTWHGFAVKILEFAGLANVPCHSITSDELNRPAIRPTFSIMDTGLYTELTGRNPRPWEEALREYMRETGELASAS